MNAKSLLLTTIVPVIGLAILSLPAGAECWMTCPPGSATTPSATGEQGTAATAEPAASPEEVTPAKKTQATGQGLAYSCAGEADSSSNPRWGNGGTGHLT